MAVVGLPLLYASREEFKLFNDFIEAHPSPKSKDFEAHCRDMLTKADYKMIFPKTPSMAKSQLN